MPRKQVEHMTLQQVNSYIAGLERLVQVTKPGKLLNNYKSKLKRAQHHQKYWLEKKAAKSKRDLKMEQKQISDRFNYLISCEYSFVSYQEFCSDLLYYLQTR